MNKGKELLTKLCAGLKTLGEDEFEYAHYISDSIEDCGTVCCALGWTPRFIPEASFTWEENEYGLSLRYKGRFKLGMSAAKEEFELSGDWVYFIFYGGELSIEFGPHNEELFGDGDDVTLAQVINRIEYTLDNAY